MYPDDVALLVHVLDRVGETLVHGLFRAVSGVCRFGCVVSCAVARFFDQRRSKRKGFVQDKMREEEKQREKEQREKSKEIGEANAKIGLSTIRLIEITATIKLIDVTCGSQGRRCLS